MADDLDERDVTCYNDKLKIDTPKIWEERPDDVKSPTTLLDKYKVQGHSDPHR